MLGSEILDVALGLGLVFLLLSFVATAIREAIESVMKARAVHLESGIRELLGDPTGTGLARAFYEHPLIYTLYHGVYEPVQNRHRGGKLPTYIPAKSFADAVVDLTIRGPVASEYAVAQTGAKLSVESLRENIGRLRNPVVMRVVLTAIDHGGNDLNKVRENLQHWFDSAMDRVSGRYKRRTHFWLFGIGLVLAAALNVNAITLAKHLSRNKALRETMVTRVVAVTRDTEYQRMLGDSTFRKEDVRRVAAEMSALELPIGAERYAWPKTFPEGIQMGLGILITALAITLGAPFWFDALNKMMVIRSTVKPREKSQEEGSEDRKADAPKREPSPPPPQTPAGGSSSQSRTGPPVSERAPTLSAEATAVLVGSKAEERNQWNSGTGDEGII